MQEGQKILVIPALTAICLIAALVYFGGGGSYPLAPDPDLGARAESGPFSNGIDTFFAYSAGSEVLIRRIQKKTGRIRIKDACEGPVLAVAVSPAVKLLAVAGAGREIRLFDISAMSGLGAKRPKPAGSISGGVPRISALAFSSDGKRLLVLGQEAAELWDTASKSVLGRLDGPLPDTGSFLLYAGESAIRASEARLEYAVNENAVERGGFENPPVLTDAFSGRTLNTFGKPFSESWGPGGRFRGYADGGDILIWRLCRRATCRAVNENGKTVMR